VDRKSLPAPEQGVEQGYVAPRNEVERRLSELWAELLGIEQVGIHDNFFELGGHSLLAVRLLSAIRNDLGVELSIGEIFDLPTITLQAARLGDMSPSTQEMPLFAAGPRPSLIPLSFSQERLWFIDQLEGSVSYHIPTVLRLHGMLRAEDLEQAFRSLLQRHEALRTVIRQNNHEPHQIILPADNWQLRIIEQYRTDQQWLKEHIASLISIPFDLAADYPIRAHLLRSGENEHMLVVTIHHIASDGWSIPIMIGDFTAAYKACVAGRSPGLPPLPVQYADYALWQRRYLQGAVLQRKLKYWTEQLSGVMPLRLPADRKRQGKLSGRGSAYEFIIDREIMQTLYDLGLETGATLFMTLLSVLKILLSRLSGQSNIAIGTTVANRGMREVEGLIGYFVNTLVLRSEIQGEFSFRELLLAVRRTTLQGYAHQDVPFEKVVEAVVRKRDMDRNPLFDVMFTLHNNERARLEEANFGVDIAQENIFNETSKFDLAFSALEEEQGCVIVIEYSMDLYEKETIQKIAHWFKVLLIAIAGNPDQRIMDIRLLSMEDIEKRKAQIDNLIAESDKALFDFDFKKRTI